MMVQAAFHWGVVPVLMKILRARTMVGENLVREEDTMVLIFQINCTICHTIIIMVHLVVINKMGFSTIANINIVLLHGGVEDDITSRDLKGEKDLLEMKVWGNLLSMKGIKQITKVIKSLTTRFLQDMT